jgi:tetratricopeptide (TPR) repeat protein
LDKEEQALDKLKELQQETTEAAEDMFRNTIVARLRRIAESEDEIKSRMRKEIRELMGASAEKLSPKLKGMLDQNAADQIQNSQKTEDIQEEINRFFEDTGRTEENFGTVTKEMEEGKVVEQLEKNADLIRSNTTYQAMQGAAKLQKLFKKWADLLDNKEDDGGGGDGGGGGGEPNEDAIKRIIELLRLRQSQMGLKTAVEELDKLKDKKSPQEFDDIAAELAFQQFELERDLKLERDQRGDGKFLPFAQSDMAESRNLLDKVPIGEIGQQQLEATADHLEKAATSLEQAFEKASQAVEDAETPEEATVAEKARKLAGETADRLRKLVSEARNTDNRRGNISDLLLDLSDIENRIGRAQETINEIQKEIDDNKNCGDGDDEDLVEAKKELDQALKDRAAKQQALTDAIQAALEAAIDLGRKSGEAQAKQVPPLEKAIKEAKVDAEEELDGLKMALAEAAKRAGQAAQNLKQHQELADADRPTVRPPTGKPTFGAQAAVVLKIEREIKDLMQAASGGGEGESDPQEIDPETLKLLMEMMRMLGEQGLMPDSPPSQSQAQGSGPPSQGSGQGQSPGQSNSGGTTNRDNSIDGDPFNRNDPDRNTPQASGANGRVPTEYQDKIQAYLRALRANQKGKNK